MPFIAVLLWFLLVPQIGLSQGAQYSAIVMDMTGKVSVNSERGKRSLDLGQLLYPGDKVETGGDATITINYLHSGEEENWPGGLTFTVGKTQSSPVHSRMKKQNRQIHLPTIKTPQKGGFTMKRAGGFIMKEMGFESRSIDSLERDIGEVKGIEVKGLSNTWILEERPTFRWNSVKGAESYKVTLYRDSREEPLWQSTTTETEIPYPQSQGPLNPGLNYNWDVKALAKGEPIAEKQSCFYLPKDQDRVTLIEEKKPYVSQLMERPGEASTRLAYILFLENRHLYDEAIDQYEILNSNRESQSIKGRQGLLLQIRNSVCDVMDE
jgi:hypothetical protein